MLEEQSGSESQENVEQNVQTDTQDSGQNLTDTLNQEKVYSQKQRQRSQKAEAEVEKLTARLKKMEEDTLAEQGKFKEMWERDKDDAEWARGYKKTRKASLLDNLPEDKREKFKNLDLTSLEAVVEELTANTNKEQMKAVPGQVSTPTLNKAYKDMTDAEKRQWHSQVVESKN